MDTKLPATWTVSTLGAVAHGFVSGGTPSTKNEAFWRGSVPWITSKWLNARLYLDTGEKFISDDAVRQSATTVVPRNNLIFATRVGVGKVAVNRLDLAINQDLAGVLIDPERYDIRFIAYQLRSERVQNVVSSHKRGATIQGITRDHLKELEINLPPLAEQRKIAGLLELVQRAMEQQERLIALTTELKKVILHQVFTQGLRAEPQKQTEIGPVPQSWDVVELISAVEQIDYGFSAPIPKTPPENSIKIVSTADITKDGRLRYGKIRRIEAPEKTVKRLTLRTGDVLFNWRNSAELIGKTAVFQEQDEAHVFASFILRIRCGEKKSHNFYLANLMNHFREKEVFIKLARRAVNQANYNRNEISILKIPLPSYQEQREIAGVIAVADAKIDLQRRKHAALTALFRTLLHQLITAELHVHDLDLPRLLEDI